jgi:hypothetical protein
MEANPADPSVPVLRRGTHTAHSAAGVPLHFRRRRRLSPSHASAGGRFSPPHEVMGRLLRSPHHRKFSSLRAPAGGPMHVSPAQQKLGDVLCNLPYLPLFQTSQTSVATALPSRIAIPHRDDLPSMPSQMRMAEGVHHSGGIAPSCRRCLIACNSRQVDEDGGA